MTEEQFTTHYLQSSKRLEQFVKRFRGDTEDICSTTWMRAWKHKDNFQYKCSFYSWLCTIVKNEFLCNIRKIREASLEQVKIDPIIFIEQHLENKLYLDEILSKIKPEQRQLLRLYYQDMDIEALAKLYNATRGSVKMKLHKILEILRTPAKYNKSLSWKLLLEPLKTSDSMVLTPNVNIKIYKERLRIALMRVSFTKDFKWEVTAKDDKIHISKKLLKKAFKIAA